ncbi:MAG: UDP-N-acetylmuramoyl-tripeptide--D-alanyl-D-alanine ligase [Chitinophagales bacterium]|nr:UDP-N-acetylmuramoyl-tripeptide--D-alanyl-D-alanine ligase [Chitinophagales bacterium]
MEIKQLYTLFLQSTGVVTDSRKVYDNSIFFALKGSNFNGNEYATKAIQDGASYAIIDEKKYQINEQYILVDDVLATLQQLALHHRQQVAPKAVIALTGSNGKTTTKELLSTVLTTKYKTHFTKGNLNNHIGIPLTLLAMPSNTEIAVIEMGANHQEEIKSYCKFTQPTHGLITNIGKAHLEGFGGIEGVKKGKGELFDYLKANDGIVFYNINDENIIALIKEKQIANKYSYGFHSILTTHFTILQEFPSITLDIDNTKIASTLYGNYNLDNILCAIGIGKFFEIPTTTIKMAIEAYQATNSRSQVIDWHQNKVILDCYNANPTSMYHALQNFAKSKSTNKIVILGDMFELGEAAQAEHQYIVNEIEKYKFNTIVLVGKLFYNCESNESVLKFETTDEAVAWFNQQTFKDAEILIKASRGMQLEKLITQ